MTFNILFLDLVNSLLKMLILEHYNMIQNYLGFLFVLLFMSARVKFKGDLDGPHR